MKYFILILIIGSIVRNLYGREMVKIKSKEYGKVFGKVVEKGTNKPLGAVRIWIYDKYGSIISVSQTDMDGKYDMRHSPLQTGIYYFRVPSNEWGTKGKYLEQFFNNVKNWRNATLVEVAKGKKLTNIDFYLEKGATIVGCVKCNGKVIKEDSLSIVVYDAYKRYSYINYETATDSIGKYVINSIAPGKYKVYIKPKHYVGTFYGQTKWWERASIINIENVKDTIKGIDVSVRRGGKISGYVFSEDEKKPIPNVTVYCSRDSYSTDSTGYFEFAGLDTGNYIIEVRMGYKTESIYANQYYKCSATYDEANLIEIKDEEEVKDINIYLKEGGKIPITVIDENGAPIKGFVCQLIPQEAQRVGRSCWGIGGSSFEYPNILPGMYTIQIKSSNEEETGISYITTYYKNAMRFKNASFIEVRGGYKTKPITIVLKQGSWIQGFLNHNSSPIDGDSTKFSILVYDTESGNLIGIGHNTFCGGYKVTNLPIGKCKIAVLNCNSHFAIQYYKNGTTFDDPRSDIVNLKKGKPEIDINFEIDTASCIISGKVIDIDRNGIPLLSVYVCAYDTTGHIVQMVSVKEGRYELKNLRPGKYAIRTLSNRYKDKWYDNVNLVEPDDFDNQHYFVKVPDKVNFLILNKGQKITNINFSLSK